MSNFTDHYGRRIRYTSARQLRKECPPASDECEIPDCSHQKTGYLSRLVYDHCHQCGYIRGTICGYCNRQLGRYERNIPHLGSGNVAFDVYLNRHQCKVTLPA
jgi:hypothetical protein